MFGKEIILDAVINQLGEEQAKELHKQLLSMVDKMSDDKMYIITKIKGKGICLINTDKNNSPLTFKERPTIIELENMVKDIEI